MSENKLSPKTIERIEREAKKHAGSDGLTYGYTCGATREALLVLPVLEAAKIMVSSYAKGEGAYRAFKKFNKLVSAYEQGTVK